jgi:hypothetical protein
MSTICTLTSPYSHLSSHEKSRVHSVISNETFKYLFTNVLPRQGSQDRVVAQLLQKFEKALRDAGVKEYYLSTNETIAQKLLDSVTFKSPPPLPPESNGTD